MTCREPLIHRILWRVSHSYTLRLPNGTHSMTVLCYTEHFFIMAPRMADACEAFPLQETFELAVSFLHFCFPLSTVFPARARSTRGCGTVAAHIMIQGFRIMFMAYTTRLVYLHNHALLENRVRPPPGTRHPAYVHMSRETLLMGYR